jgi:hypothetical protein
MRSDLVVISWWSNCLGLTCLFHLARHTKNRSIYVVQVGKSAAQRERFRDHLPSAVKELPYPANLPAEHCRVIEAVARDLLGDHRGLWFFDHDFFILENLEPWLTNMDWELEQSACCLCHLQPLVGPSITVPAFWMSPTRFPRGLPCFDTIPYKEMKVSQRPDLFRAQANLMMPEKDTLVLAREFLAEQGMICGFSSHSLPRSDHLGGLYMFAGEILLEPFRDWMESRVERFTAFYEKCPHEWVAAEDPVLLERFKEFQRAVSSGHKGCKTSDVVAG